MKENDQKQNVREYIAIVVLALVHLFIVGFFFNLQSNITEFTSSLDMKLPMRYYLIHGISLTPIFITGYGLHYFFKHRQKFSRKEIIHKWFVMLLMGSLYMIPLTWLFIFVSVHDPVYDTM